MDLREGETVLYEGRPSWRALLSFYILGMLIAVAALAFVALVLDKTGIGATVFAVVFVGTLLIGWLRRVFTKYAITDQRLRISRGIIARKVQETRLDRVQNVNYTQGVIDRVLGVGTVDFDTAGTDDSDFTFAWINGPEQVVQAVQTALHET